MVTQTPTRKFLTLMNKIALGILIVILANLFIGFGQVTQKKAINRIETFNSFNSGKLSRLKDIQWIFGIVLFYVGEGGNWISLSLISPAVIVPMGVLSVLVNVIFGKLWLNEVILPRQYKGYALVILGVLFLISGAPKGNSMDISQDEIIKYVSSAPFILKYLMFVFIQATFIRISQQRKDSYTIYVYVNICALFATMTVMLGKILSSLIMHMTDTISVLWYLLPSFLIAINTFLQEFFRQKALSEFSVSRFIPILFATFNGWCILATIILFGEFETFADGFIFFTLYIICMAIIITGVYIIQGGEGYKKLEEIDNIEIKEFN